MNENVEVADAGQRFLGKYRGKVIDNNDPLGVGRVVATVPAVSEQQLSWAMPCVPYAGPNVGFFAIPPVGANIWVEFEGGDPDFPIWVGGFWDEAAEMPSQATGPEKKVWQSENATLMFDDNGELTAEIETDNGVVSLSLGDDGVTLTGGGLGLVDVTINQSGIMLDAVISKLHVGLQGIQAESGGGISKIGMTDGAIRLGSGPAGVEINPALLSLKVGNSSIIINPASVDITNGVDEQVD